MHARYLNTIQIPAPLLPAPHAALEDTAEVGSLELLPDAVLSEQFYSPPRGAAHLQSEVAFMRAVLDDAISCYQKRFVPHTRRERRLAQEAAAWLFNNDDRWPFSFVNVCRASLEQMGKLEDCLAQLRHRQGDAAPALPLPKRRSAGIRMG